MGLIIAIVVTAANKHDGVTACSFFNQVINRFKNTKCIFADHSYKGQFKKLMDENNITLEIAAA